jgi:CysZ protein
MSWADGAKNAAKKAAIDLPKATVVGFGRGLTYPFRGFHFVFIKHPSLVRFWIFPIVITICLLIASTIFSWSISDDALNWLWSEPTDEGFWGTVARVTHWIVEKLIFVIVWAVLLVAVVFLTNVIAAPFNDLLSEEVEHLITGVKGPDFTLGILLRDAVRTIGLEIVKLLIYCVIMLPLFVLAQLLPAVGQIAYSIFAFLFTALYFAVDYVDWPASRRNRSITYRFGMLQDHFLPMFGFGTGVWAFLFVPIVNLWFMPAAVAGGTMLFLELEGEKKPAPAPALEPGTPVDPMSETAGASDGAS